MSYRPTNCLQKVCLLLSTLMFIVAGFQQVRTDHVSAFRPRVGSSLTEDKFKSSFLTCSQFQSV